MKGRKRNLLLLLLFFSFLSITLIPLNVHAASLVQETNDTWTFLGIKWRDLSCIIIGVLISKLIHNASKIYKYKSTIDFYKDRYIRAEAALRESNDEIRYKKYIIQQLRAWKANALEIHPYLETEIKIHIASKEANEFAKKINHYS